MKKQIIKELDRLEKEHQIRILYAVESGSRAWGFASQNSDWDVRCLYIHKFDWYCRIDRERDNLGEILPDDIDLVGWELKKTLRLFRKSNPPLLEWLKSPIVYRRQGSSVEKMRKLTDLYFNRKACFHHYLNVAIHNFEFFRNSDTMELKKLFYTIRTLLACAWLLERKTTVPVEFRTLLDNQVKEQNLRDEILNLMEKKCAGNEKDKEMKSELLQDYLAGKIEHFKERAATVKKPEIPGTEPLNALFREALHETWGCYKPE